MKRRIFQSAMILSSILLTACVNTQPSKTTTLANVSQPTYPIVITHFDKYAKKTASIVETQDSIIYYDANDQEIKRENKITNGASLANNATNNISPQSPVPSAQNDYQNISKYKIAITNTTTSDQTTQNSVQEEPIVTSTPSEEITVATTPVNTTTTSTNNYIAPKKSEYYANGMKVGTVEETPTETKYYNYKGKLAGSKTTEDDTTTYYDKKGNEVASRQETAKGADYYNDRGKKIGSEKTKKDTTYYYDGKGNYTGAEKQLKKGSIYYDNSGQITGSTYIKGNKTYVLDGSGAVIAIKKNK